MRSSSGLRRRLTQVYFAFFSVLTTQRGEKVKKVTLRVFFSTKFLDNRRRTRARPRRERGGVPQQAGLLGHPSQPRRWWKTAHRKTPHLLGTGFLYEIAVVRKAIIKIATAVLIVLPSAGTRPAYGNNQNHGATHIRNLLLSRFRNDRTFDGERLSPSFPLCARIAGSSV